MWPEANSSREIVEPHTINQQEKQKTNNNKKLKREQNKSVDIIDYY